jgi:hypothetical protein
VISNFSLFGSTFSFLATQAQTQALIILGVHLLFFLRLTSGMCIRTGTLLASSHTLEHERSGNRTGPGAGARINE